MIDKVNCFILSAGLGTRMKPITEYIPKPLLPILGKPAIDHILEQVSSVGIKKIGINLHYKGNLIEQWLSKSLYFDSLEINLFFEDELLGTGGALKNAKSFLKDGYFLVYNSDIISDLDIEKLLNFHLAGGFLVSLAIHDHQQFNNLLVSDDGFLIKVIDKEYANKLYAFTGVAIYSPDFLDFLKEGYSSVIDGWLKAISKGAKVSCLIYEDLKWFDIGTPYSYASAVFRTLKDSGESLYVHPHVICKEPIYLQGCVVIENDTELAKNTYLKNCILLPHTHIKEGMVIENSIVIKDYLIKLPKEVCNSVTKKDMILVGEGGSDRKYYRFKKADETFIFMETNKEDGDFKRQVELTKFFFNIGIPVPELIEVNYENYFAVFEDLGDISLYKWLKFNRPDEEVEEIYKKVLDSLFLLHTLSPENISKCLFIKERVFDYEHLRWESRYFLERFLRDVRKIFINDIEAIDFEFHRLALTIDSYKKVVIHRDLQSQNIMISKDKQVKFIDYQGVRMGPMAYDLASLLWDPYSCLKDSIRDKLLKYYLDRLSKEASDYFEFDERDFHEELIFCRIHRHMQALGAFSFLSKVKGKKFFLKYIPEALRLLKDDSKLLKSSFPALYNLISKL
ncbi:MAG: phosphotransferase [Thermodesulfovibrionales bacterium]|nr:phosphotransferase [Thermodesulfovibrionales bacterium]